MELYYRVPMTASATAGVILAAGASRRFGAPKQLARFAGQPLILRVCEIALAAELQPLVVVLGACAEDVAARIQHLPVECAYNDQWASGMASSLRCGIQHLERITHSQAAAISLVDQPLIDAAHLKALCALRARAQVHIAATRYGDTLGAPAVFARALFDQLCALRGDRGAGALIRASASRVALAFEDAAIDIDRPEDLETAHRRRDSGA